jgi:diketogulonate reductase-like aldo/keto reductase
MSTKNYTIRTAGQANIPVLGLGTWQSTGQDCIDVVSQGLKMGYEHIDTAQAYDNEKEVGKGIKQSGVARDKFFLTTKIFPDDMKFEPEKLIAAAKRSLENLDTDYVDLLLLHWPDDRVPLSETMPALCELQKQGLTRNIGVSNFNIANIIEAKKYADVPIAVNQVEFHPFIKQNTLQTFLNNHHILLEAYSPLARGDVFDNEVIKEITIQTPGIFRTASGELLCVSFSPLTAGKNFMASSAISAANPPNTKNDMRQPTCVPIKVIIGKPKLTPKVLPAIMIVIALPCIFSGTSAVP